MGYPAKFSSVVKAFGRLKASEIELIPTAVSADYA